jgi:uncharacterized membrane protein (GlpM family)
VTEAEDRGLTLAISGVTASNRPRLGLGWAADGSGWCRSGTVTATGSSMTELAARFALGGLIVALVPTVAARLGPGIAGVMTLVPVITLLSFASLGAARGPVPVEGAALGALLGLPASVAFLVAAYVALRIGWGVTPALVLATGGWLVTACPLSLLITRIGA